MNVALHPAPINWISLCTGGGGLDLGLELAMPGSGACCLVEREAFAVARLVEAMHSGLMAPAPVWSDVRTLDGRAWCGLVDGVVGGIPCQPHSLAGKRLGREDPRDLWSAARRILVQSGAWWVLIENVGGMLSSGGGADRVRRDLLRLGFRVEGGLFSAAEVGASHERERVFILGVADSRCAKWRADACGRDVADRQAGGRQQGPGRPAEPGAVMADTDDQRSQRQWDGDRALGRQAAQRHAGLGGRAVLVDTQSLGRGEGWPEPVVRGGRDTAACNGVAVDDAEIARGRPVPAQQGRQGQDRPALDRPGLFPPGPGDIDGWRDAIERAPELEPAVCRVADGLASRVDQLRLLGNGVVPLVAAHALRTLATRLARSGSAGADELVRRMTA